MYQISTIPAGYYEKNRLLDVKIDDFLIARRIEKQGCVQYAMIAGKDEIPISKKLFEEIYYSYTNIIAYYEYCYIDENFKTYYVLENIPVAQLDRA